MLRDLPGRRRRAEVKEVSPQERTQEDWNLQLLGNLRADVVMPGKLAPLATFEEPVLVAHRPPRPRRSGREFGPGGPFCRCPYRVVVFATGEYTSQADAAIRTARPRRYNFAVVCIA
jgi:hypothetical protein